MTVHYTIKLADPNTHELEISMRFELPSAQEVTVSLPAWIPGSYMIRDFAKNLLSIRACDDSGHSLPLVKTDKQTWRLEAVAGTNHLIYLVYAYDLSVRAAFFDNTRAYFNGTTVFLSLHGSEEEPHFLQLESGTTSDKGDWSVATGMPAVEVCANGFGTYRAENYAELIDYPFEIAEVTRSGFDLQGIQHEMVFSDAPGIDLDRICKDVSTICSEHVAMFGELPLESYLFMTLATSDGYGGLEHMNSTSLVCKRADLPYPNTGKIEKGYRTFLALCSHEYFHLWNVKRIRPQVFIDSGLEAEVHTELLWAFEGITSYYDELALPRCGVIEADQYLDMLAPTVTRYLRNPGRYRQSVAESSFDAWTKFYKQDENAANAIVSYYLKGTFVAFGLDILIREQTDDELCLDDLMRKLWQRYGKTGKGIPERTIEAEVSALTGKPVDDFFADYIYGTAELPLKEWFARVGVGTVIRGAVNPEDRGSVVGDPKVEKSPRNGLQAMVAEKSGDLTVVSVINGGSAQLAGLASGDILLAIDKERCTQANYLELLNRKCAGETVLISYFRRDQLITCELVLQENQTDTCDLYWIDETELSAEVLARKHSWLRSSLLSSQGSD